MGLVFYAGFCRSPAPNEEAMCVLCSKASCADPESHADPRLDAPRGSRSYDPYEDLPYDLDWDDCHLDDEFLSAREDRMSRDRLWDEHLMEETEEAERAREDLRRYSESPWRNHPEFSKACCGNPMCDGNCGITVRSDDDEIFCENPACDGECSLPHKPLRDFS